MEETKEKNKEEVRFNLGQAQLELIAELLKESSIQYLKGNKIKWFFTMKNIKFQIVSRLSTDERKELAESERLIITLYKMHNQTRDMKYQNRMAYLIEKYDIRIKELLETKGFLVPSRESKTDLYGQEG